MPAHKSSNDVGRLKLGNGHLLTEIDRICNDMADGLAKDAAHTHKVPDEVIGAIVAQEKLVEDTAKLIAEMTWAANHQTQEPLCDTDASRAAAAQAALIKARTAKPKRGKWKKVVELRPPTLGGHDLRKHGSWWRCTTCKRQSSSWCKIAPKECEGSCARKWAESAKKFAEQETTLGEGLVRAFSGDMAWCTRFGCYADNVTQGLAKPCQGRPNLHTTRCLKAFKRGRHPRTNAELGPPQYEVVNGRRPIVQSQPTEPEVIIEMPVQNDKKRKVEAVGPTTAEKRAALLARVRAKEARAIEQQLQQQPRRRINGKRKLSLSEEFAFTPRRRFDG